MNRLIACLATIFFLSGCVSTEVLMFDDYTVVIESRLKTPVDAQIAANEKCEAIGKVAKLDQIVHINQVWGNYFFSCYEKSS